MDKEQWTPTTDDVRATYSMGWREDTTPEQGSADFDRWLKAHDADVWEQGARFVAPKYGGGYLRFILMMNPFKDVA